MGQGCYRCGLPEGGEDRLCETCYRMRFHKGRDVIDLPPGVPLEGLEFSPALRAFLLGLGSLLYIGLVGFCAAAQSAHDARTVGNPRLEFATDGQRQSVVQVQHIFEAIKVPHH